MRLDKLFIALLDTSYKFVIGASVGLLGMVLVDRILCPGIFLDSTHAPLWFAALSGFLVTITWPRNNA